MSCDPERVTAYVDETLDETGREEMRAHLEGCAACAAQAAFERELRDRLRSLPEVEPRPELEAAIRARLRRRPRPWRFLVPLAAALALFLWGRGAAPFVALELARDHAKCFSLEKLPAEVWSGEPTEIAGWFDKQGTRLPVLPAQAAGLELVGARYCPVGDRQVAHVYYEGEARRLSLFVVPGPVRFEDKWTGEVRGRTVSFLRTAGTTVALVSERSQDVEAFEQAFSTTVARAETAATAAGPP
jgi:anti-sigma factor RsiW